MTNELERLKTTCLAQEVEIARLQAGFDELKRNCVERGFYSESYTNGYNHAMSSVLKEINRITGESE